MVTCSVVNSALYLSHSLGGSTKNDQRINKLGFSHKSRGRYQPIGCQFTKFAKIPSWLVNPGGK